MRPRSFFNVSWHPAGRALERHFRALGLEVATRFTPEGHSFGAWRAALPEMLEWLLAPEP